MILRADGRTYRGAAVDVHGVPAAAVVGAIRDEPSPVSVLAADPGPVHEHVGHVPPSGSLPLRAALAAAARTRGHAAPQDEAIERVRADLAGIAPPEVDREEARRRVAAAGEREERLHERVAELRGRVQTLRDRSTDAGDAKRRLREAAAELSEARTERIAAQQALEDAEASLRESRDRRERRLRLRDRLDNLRRAARERLVAAAWDEFGAAVRAVPGNATVGDDPGSYRGDDCTAALAVARVAERSAPVVLSCGRFPDAATAAACLGPPVVRVRGSSGG